MRLQDYDIDTQYRATLVSTRRITDAATDEVREIQFDTALPAEGLQPGQSIGVLAPGQEEFGQDHHFRLYTVADLPERTPDGETRIRICVRRCNYIDEYNGEEYRGVASNYLCDLREGDAITVTGPYGMAFEVPAEEGANLILIGTGTGIAPFRALIRHLYEKEPPFAGQVRLFYGGRTGLDLLYMNDKEDDLARYYDHETFRAIQALSARPGWSEAIDWGRAMESHAAELWEMLSDAKTYVYVAGIESIRDGLDGVLSSIAGSEDVLFRRKAELEAGGRWVELLY